MYAISVPMKKSTSISNIADRAVAYGMPGIVVDGMDVIAVYRVVKEAVERARAGKGPTLIECKTYRFRGHFEGDPKQGGVYRTEAEMAEWQSRCPISSLKTKLIESQILGEKEIETVELGVARDIEEATEFALNSPFPSASEVEEYVLATNEQGRTEA